jgi:hypothetical protein
LHTSDKKAHHPIKTQPPSVPPLMLLVAHRDRRGHGGGDGDGGGHRHLSKGRIVSSVSGSGGSSGSSTSNGSRQAGMQTS